MIKSITFSSNNNISFGKRDIITYKKLKKERPDTLDNITVGDVVIMNNQEVLNKKLDMNIKINLAILESLVDIGYVSIGLDEYLEHPKARLDKLRKEEHDLFYKA